VRLISFVCSFVCSRPLNLLNVFVSLARQLQDVQTQMNSKGGQGSSTAGHDGYGMPSRTVSLEDAARQQAGSFACFTRARLAFA
jgi:hypothetical protein